MSDFNAIIRQAAGYATEETTSETERARAADGRFARDVGAENRAIRRAAGYGAEPPPAPAGPASSDPDDAAWLAAEGPIWDAIEAAARAAGFIDPGDATVRLRYNVPMGADGLPDPQALSAAVRDIARASPHLVRSFPFGAGDGGARATLPPGTNMNDLIRRLAGR